MTSPAKPPTRDRQRKAKARREVGLARITTEYAETGQAALSACSCGQEFFHQRTKPREKAIQRHVDKHHEGRAIWL